MPFPGVENPLRVGRRLAAVRLIAVLIGSCLASLTLKACHPSAPPTAEQPIPSEVAADSSFVALQPDTVEVRSAAPGQALTYGVTMAAGDILHLRIEQRGLDVEIHWPQEPPKVDLPYGKFVPEELWWHATAETEIRFDVVVSGGQGDYRLVVEKLGPADESDVLRAAAFWQHRRVGDLEKIPEEHLLAAAQAWQTAKAPVQEAPRLDRSREKQTPQKPARGRRRPVGKRPWTS